MAAAVVAVVMTAAAQAQWLEDQKTDRALWEMTGVPLPEGMGFYKLTRLSQRLSIVNDVHVSGIYSANYRGRMIEGPNPNDKQLWREPGGLHWAPTTTWRNATAAKFPAKVEVYRTMTKVLNSFGYHQDNAVVRWRFPDGTQFADLLIAKRPDGTELPFELRLRTKVRGEWQSEAWRPYGEDNAPAGTVKTKVRGAVHDATAEREWEALVLPDDAPFPTGKFVKTSTPNAGAFVTKGYYGPVAKCAQCHDRAGESGSYAGVNAPGSDGVIGWHPFTMATLNTDAYPQVDARWAVHVGR